MKKAIALLLTAMLLAVTPLALADTIALTDNADGFDVTINLPSEATVSVETYDNVPYTFISFSNGDMPLIYISIAPTEEYDDTVTLATLSKEEVENLYHTVSADMDDPSYSLTKTVSGYDYMLVQDSSETDSALMVILYQGYFVQMSVWNANYNVLTDDDTNVAVSLLDTLEIKPA